MISLIIPCFNEEESLPLFYPEVTSVLQEMNCDYELIFVNDGSRDITLEILKELSEKDPHVIYLSFSRNFGKEAAIFAGLKEAKGDCCVIMDCDLQHPPATIVEMYRLWEEGYEVVEGVKASRGKENPLHTFCANGFYSIISRLTGSSYFSAIE